MKEVESGLKLKEVFPEIDVNSVELLLNNPYFIASHSHLNLLMRLK